MSRLVGGHPRPRRIWPVLGLVVVLAVPAACSHDNKAAGVKAGAGDQAAGHVDHLVVGGGVLDDGDRAVVIVDRQGDRRHLRPDIDGDHQACPVRFGV